MGQSNEIPITVARNNLDNLPLADRFAEAHEQLYGFARRDHPVEIASLWVTVTVATADTPLALLPKATATPKPATRRPVYFGGKAFDTAIFSREALLAGAKITGPAIVEQDDSTTVIPPGWEGTTDEWGNLVIAEC